MILDIDIGNTRIKWILRGVGAEPVVRGVFAHGQWSDLDEPFAFQHAVTRVRLSSVAGEVDCRVRAICQERWDLEPEIARVVDGAAGVVCGYTEPVRLGIDRWLGVIAGWSRYAEAFLVADAGSALTVDLVDNQGVHLGGYILPGFEMMRTALGFHTWGVRVGAERTLETGPGRATSSAVNNGCLAALLGAVERIAEYSGVKRVLLTGGDTELLAKQLQTKAEVVAVPDLVLDGLAIALP